MSQYREIKKQYHDSILLFRVGDFYETFYEDAIDIASILNITLTSRDKNKAVPVPLAGVPFHAAEGYIGRLLAAGRKVAICEQTEDPALAKGLVRRDVVEVLTPGTALNSQLVADPDNNYCAAVHADGNGRVSVALIDVGTGEFTGGEAPADSFLHLLQGKHAREIVVSDQIDPSLRALLLEHLDNPFITEVDESQFSAADVEGTFMRQFGSSAESAAGLLTDRERVVTARCLTACACAERASRRWSASSARARHPSCTSTRRPSATWSSSIRCAADATTRPSCACWTARAHRWETGNSGTGCRSRCATSPRSTSAGARCRVCTRMQRFRRPSSVSWEG
jgi:DNA mismatch repair protein MutS